MPSVSRPCGVPGCSGLDGGCDIHRRAVETRRGSRHERGYDTAWERARRRYLVRHPICVLCGGLANVADHYPVSRRDLVARGVRDPDADHRLRALCAPCHRVETNRHQPGGWNAR